MIKNDKRDDNDNLKIIKDALYITEKIEENY